jgi:hypothetical protein
MRAIARVLGVVASMTAGVGAICGAQAQTHLVCIGEFESVCKKLPITDFYGCGDTGPNAICFRYCGRPETPQTCVVSRRGGPSSGNKCGYSWVEVRCLGG